MTRKSYWSRRFLVQAVCGLLLACAILDAIQAARAPITLRQAKRSARGLKKSIDLAEDLLDMTKAYVEDLKDIAGERTRVRCAVGRARRALDSVANNCTEHEIATLRASIEDMWNATSHALRGLNCSREFSRSSVLMMHPLCRRACAARDDVDAAWTLYQNLSYGAWVAQTAEVAGEVSVISDATTAGEMGVTDLANTLGFSVGTFDVGDAASELQAVAACLASSREPAPIELAPCQMRRDLKFLREMLRGAKLAIEWAEYALDFAGLACDMVLSVDSVLLAAAWCLVLALHVSTLAFIEYVVRTPNNFCSLFWLFYFLHDLFFWLVGFLLVVSTLVVIVGEPQTCDYFYDLNPRLRSWLVDFREAAETSCFEKTADAAADVDPYRSSSSSCNYSDRVYHFNLFIVMIATYCLILLQWLVLHWFPAAMGFARTKTLVLRPDSISSMVTRLTQPQLQKDRLTQPQLQKNSATTTVAAAAAEKQRTTTTTTTPKQKKRHRHATSAPSPPERDPQSLHSDEDVYHISQPFDL